MCCCETDYAAEEEAKTQTNTVRVLAALMGLSDVTEHTYQRMEEWRGVSGKLYPSSIEEAGLTFQVHGRWGWLAADGKLNAHGLTLDTEDEATAELIAYMTEKETS